MKTIWRNILAAGLATLAAGCTDPDHVVFVTTSQFGVAADAATQHANVGLDRYEAVVAPVFDEGALPPVYARLGTDGGFFTPQVSQLYATGNAALIASQAKPQLNCVKDDGKPVRWTGDGDDPCKVPVLTSVEPAERKRMFFGTSTSLGLAVKGTADAPGSIHFGFKRRELSVIPLTNHYDDDGKATGEQGYASTLAAINARVQEGCEPGQTGQNQGVCLSQFFATGEAAVGVASDTNAKVVTIFKEASGKAAKRTE